MGRRLPHRHRRPRAGAGPVRVLVALVGAVAASLVGLGQLGPAAPAGAPTALPAPEALPVPLGLQALLVPGTEGEGEVPGAAPAASPTRGTGRLVPVTSAGERVGTGPLARYDVQVEQGLGVRGEDFASAVERVLSHPRGWTSRGEHALQRVGAGADGEVAFTVVLASPELTDRLCAPLTTDGIYSCFNGRQAVLNAQRWASGASAYGGDLTGYRTYLVNHEVGHALDNRHSACPAPGALAPVMLQQTISLEGCRSNPWPYVP